MTMRRRTPSPRTRSKDPVVILRTVARAILQDPKRYDQQRWLTRERDADPFEYAEFPSCGTIACVAGWVVTVTGARYSLDLFHPRFISEVAQRRLGLSDAQANQLFDGHAVRGTGGTRQHAKAGVRHIARFVNQTWGRALGVKA